MNMLRDAQGRMNRVTRAMLCSAVVVGLAATVSQAQADSNHQLRSGVEPGDVVILRKVEAVPVGRGERHSGPIVSKVNVQDGSMEARRHVTGIQAISLSDDRAAGIRSSVQGPMGSLHRAIGTESALSRGATSNGNGVNRAVSGNAGGGNAGGSVGAVTSGISGSVGKALSPLTGQK